MLLFIAAYLIACYIVAFSARKTNIGAIGFFVISLIITPLFAYLALLMASKREQ